MGIVLEGFMVEAMGGDHVPHPIRDVATLLWGGGMNLTGCSRLQDLMSKGLLVPKWAWRSGVSVGLESRGYLCPTGAIN